MEETSTRGAVRDDVLSEVEAAKYLRLSRTTLIRLRKKGAIAYTRVGNLVRYTKAQLDAYLDSCAVQEGSADANPAAAAATR